MKKFLSTILNHERYQAIALLAVCVLSGWFFGCHSRVKSLLRPQEKVTRAELAAEIDHFLTMAELRKADLDRQDNLKRQILEFTMVATQTGALNVSGLLPLAFSILGVGAIVDNTRKRKELKGMTKIEP